MPPPVWRSAWCACLATRFEVTFQVLEEPMKLDEIEHSLLSDQDTVLPWALNLNLLYVIGKHMLCMM
jgi:hypothetical protein